MTQTLPLFRNKKERRVFYLIITCIFSLNLYYQYTLFKNFTANEVFQTDATIINIYPKQEYQVVKLKSFNCTFFTSLSKNTSIKIFQKINLYILTQNIDFFSYLKGFYTKSFQIRVNQTPYTLKESLYTQIQAQHNSTAIGSLYAALFLATPLDQKMRDFASDFGVSHLIAISGFHLGLMCAILYFILHLFYNTLHAKYFPYRNKRVDIMIIISGVLLSYLIFLDLPASLLRAFVMFLFALFLLRNNIALFSFETLLIIVVFIIALFPKLLFSLSLWFSVAGVFYIFLFVRYFTTLNKYFQVILFNIWIYLAINPIVHYFFPVTTIEQLYSPLITILFTLFYPVTLGLHLFGFGDFFDSGVSYLLNISVDTHEIFTPIWILIVYLGVSFMAIFQKRFFILLNLFLIFYTLWLFQFTFKKYLFIGI